MELKAGDEDTLSASVGSGDKSKAKSVDPGRVKNQKRPFNLSKKLQEAHLECLKIIVMFSTVRKNSINFEVEENLGLILPCLSGPG